MPRTAAPRPPCELDECDVQVPRAGQRFCSRSHAQRGRDRPAAPSKACQVCGVTFEKRGKQSHEDWDTRKVCGPECQRDLPHPWRNQRGPL